MGYTLSGNGSNMLTFSNTSNNTAATITVADGRHVIDAPVVLADNLVVTTDGTNPWTLSFGTTSSITDNGSGFSLTMNGSSGTLILSGSDSYRGGTIVDAGTLIVTSNNAIPPGTSLTIGAGGTFVFDSSMAGAAITSSAAAEVNPVPEPGTLVLLSVAVCSAAVGQRIRSRRKRQ